MINVFVHEFENAFGAWRMELYRAPSGFGVPFNYIDLPPAAILSVKGLSWKYDRIPLGPPEAPSLDFTVNAEYCATNEEFRGLVFRPAFYRNILFYGSTLKVNFGTTLKLYHYEGETARLLWVGLVRDYKFSKKDQTIDCTAFDANRVCLESVNFDALDAFARARYVTLNRTLELQFGDGATEFELRGAVGLSSYAGAYELWNYIAKAGRTVKSYILGISSDDPVELGFNFSGGDFFPYKQSRTARNGLGAALTSGDTYLLAETPGNLGLFLDKKEGLPGRYKSAYDLIAEMSEQFFCRLSAWGAPRLLPFLSNYGHYELDPDRIYIDVQSSDAQIVKATGSHIERSGGKDCEDVDKCEAEIGGASRNNGDLTIPIVWSNIPPNCSTTEKGAGRNIQDGIFLYGLYYLDQVQGETVAVKVHHAIDIPISNSKNITDLPGCAFRLPDLVALGTKRTEFAYPRVAQEAVQLESGWGNVAARAAIALFGEPAEGPGDKPTFEIPGEYAREFLTAIFNQDILTLPAGALGSFSTPGSGLFIPLSNDFDFEEGVLTIEGFEVPNNAL